MDMKGKTALVTGSSRGIGRGIATEFAKVGANIAVNYTSNKDAAEVTLKAVKEYGVDGDIFQCDVGDTKASSQMVADVVKRFGALDVLVNNAAVNQPSGKPISEDDWDWLMNVNLRGLFFLCEAALKHMRERQSGRIVNISSTAALRGATGSVHYITSKAGVIGLTKALATNEAKNGIRINCLASGLVETDMIMAFMKNIPREKIEAAHKARTLGRPTTPEEMGQMVVFLATHDYITGETLCGGGGDYMR